MKQIVDRLKQLKWHICCKICLKDVIVICVIVFALSVWQSRNMLELGGSLMVDEQVLVGLDGQTSALIKPDTITLIYFFAPWCKVCSLSIENLAYLDPDKLNIVLVALDYSNVEAVQKFADEHNISGQILLGHRGLKQQFKIQGYPSYYIMDKQQKVLAKSYGYSTALGLVLRQVFSG